MSNFYSLLMYMSFFLLITGPDHYWPKKASTILLQAIKTEVYLSAFNSFIHKCLWSTYYVASVLNLSDRVSLLKELTFQWHISESIEI